MSEFSKRAKKMVIVAREQAALDRKYAENAAMETEANRLRAEANRLRAEANRLRAEANRLKAEAEKAEVEAEKAEVEAEKVADLVYRHGRRRVIGDTLVPPGEEPFIQPPSQVVPGCSENIVILDRHIISVNKARRNIVEGRDVSYELSDTEKRHVIWEVIKCVRNNDGNIIGRITWDVIPQLLSKKVTRDNFRELMSQYKDSTPDRQVLMRDEVDSAALAMCVQCILVDYESA
jgi:hypothetical protein